MASHINAQNLQTVQATLEKFVVFLERHQWVARVNTVGFFTEKMWDEIIVPHFTDDVADEITQLTEEEMARLPVGRLSMHGIGNNEVSGLQQFIDECIDHRLENTDVLCEEEDIFNFNEIEEAENLGITETSSQILVQTRALMNMKKSHEVEKLSRFAARLANVYQLQQVHVLGLWTVTCKAVCFINSCGGPLVVVVM